MNTAQQIERICEECLFEHWTTLQNRLLSECLEIKEVDLGDIDQGKIKIKMFSGEMLVVELKR